MIKIDKNVTINKFINKMSFILISVNEIIIMMIRMNNMKEVISTKNKSVLSNSIKTKNVALDISPYSTTATELNPAGYS